MSDQKNTPKAENKQPDCTPMDNAPRSGPAGAGGVAVGAQASISCAPQLASGVDTLHLSWCLDIPRVLLDELKAAKETVQKGEADGSLWKFGQTELFSWQLSRVGVRLFPFVLRQGDVTLCLSNRSADSQIPNAQLSIGSISCNNGLCNLIVTLKKWLLLYDIKVVKETVSRVDFFSDFEVDISTLHLANQSRMISRVNEVATYFSHRRLTGVQAGTSAIVLRCYDKLHELAKKQATEKQSFFQQLWGKAPDHVTRVEFQLRREALRDFFHQSCNFADVSGKAAELWRYLTDEWFRHVRRNVDRKNRHQDRETVSPFWFCVQKSFDLFAFTADRIKRKRVFNLAALVRQAGGIMATIAAGVGVAFQDIPGMLHLMDETIGRQLEVVLHEKGEKDFYRRAALACLTV